MRVVLQRVRRGRVSVHGEPVAEIGQGYVILLGVALDDSEVQARWLAHKCADLRLFEDAYGKMNLSLHEVEGEVLVVSQFTLYGDVRKGRRPSFTGAAPPELAAPLVDCFAETMAASGIAVQTGQFGEHMLVEIENDGPVTLVLERNVDD
ncbi:MAG: D-aminoacyl-tRNA deacylase [Anaerolineales bacterium]|nr:D-aminoacyl-tRNA deacylase [Anaerolineales bacterium]